MIWCRHDLNIQHGSSAARTWSQLTMFTNRDFSAAAGRSRSPRRGRLVGAGGVAAGGFRSAGAAGGRSLIARRAAARSADELEERIELARAKNLGNRRVNVAKHDAAAIRPHQPLKGHEISQCRGPGKTHTAQVDDHIGTPLSLQDGLHSDVARSCTGAGQAGGMSQNSATRMPSTLCVSIEGFSINHLRGRFSDD